MLKVLVKNENDLVPIGIVVSSFVGTVTLVKGVLSIDLIVGTRKNPSVFFVVDSQCHFNALLGRDWIHSNLCVPSSLHQSLLFWNNEDVEIVQAVKRPFMTESNAIDVVFYYNSNMSPISTVKHFVK